MSLVMKDMKERTAGFNPRLVLFCLRTQFNYVESKTKITHKNREHKNGYQGLEDEVNRESVVSRYKLLLCSYRINKF